MDWWAIVTTPTNFDWIHIYTFGMHMDVDCEKRYGVSFEKEREKRAYMEGPSQGIHPLANAAGKGLKTVLKEVDTINPHPPPPPASSVFV